MNRDEVKLAAALFREKIETADDSEFDNRTVALLKHATKLSEGICPQERAVSSALLDLGVIDGILLATGVTDYQIRARIYSEVTGKQIRAKTNAVFGYCVWTVDNGAWHCESEKTGHVGRGATRDKAYKNMLEEAGSWTCRHCQELQDPDHIGVAFQGVFFCGLECVDQFKNKQEEAAD